MTVEFERGIEYLNGKPKEIDINEATDDKNKNDNQWENIRMSDGISLLLIRPLNFPNHDTHNEKHQSLAYVGNKEKSIPEYK